MNLIKWIILFWTEEDNREKGKLYKPQAKNEEKLIEKQTEAVKLPSTTSIANASKKESSSSKKNKSQEKKKSNLELFKEELRQ